MKRKRRNPDLPLTAPAPAEPTSEFVRLVPVAPAAPAPEPPTSAPPAPAPPTPAPTTPDATPSSLDDLLDDELLLDEEFDTEDPTYGLTGLDDVATRDMVRFVSPDGDLPDALAVGGFDDPFADPFALDAELPRGLDGPLDPLLAAPPTAPDPTAPLRRRRRGPADAQPASESSTAPPTPTATPTPTPVLIVDDDVASVPPPVVTRPRPVLVIGEDTEDEPISRTPAAAAAGSVALPIDPRLRRRRVAVRRAAGRRRLILAIVAAIAGAAVIGALVLLASPVFSVDDVIVEGAVYTTDAELDEVVETVRGDAILTLDTRGLEDRIEQLPWVRSARVRADFPGTLRIELAERVPVASYQGADAQWRVIDRQGRVIAIIPDGAQPTDFLVIAGPGPDVAAGSEAGDLYRVAGELALALPAELRVVTSSITLGQTGEIGLVLTSGTVVEFGPPNDLRAKLAVLITGLRETPPSELALINLSDPGNPGFTKVG